MCNILKHIFNIFLHRSRCHTLIYLICNFTYIFKKYQNLLGTIFVFPKRKEC